jgi:arylsulfatase A-like enzyme/Tfp pilus assembly protein PilF
MQGRGHSDEQGKVARQPRAWWQWVLGLGLIGAAVVIGLVNYVPGFQLKFKRAGPRTVVPPREVVVDPDLRPVAAVPAAPGEYAGANLLVVTFDTTRPERLGCYGNDQIKTPSVDRLAREGVLFANAVAPSPTTLPSHASVLTGLYPYHHGARANGLYRLGASNVTLAEVLAGEGYTTGAIVSAFVLDSQFGIAQGFRDFDDEVGEEDLGTFEIPERSADATTKRAESWLRTHADDKFFLWVHYYDPHFPYEAPAPFRDQYAVPYDAEIAFADFELGRLLAVLDGLELTDRTLVVFAGDHGEGLGQHNEEAHACLIYDSTMRVPLIMRCGERLGGGARVDREVSLVDVVPTVLAALGVEAPDGLDGVDLAQPATGSRPIFMETLQGLADHGWAALLGVRENGMKYIYGPESELYEVDSDPFEERNQLAARPRVAAAMKASLEGFFGDDLEQAASAGDAQTLSPDAIAKLEALGYLRGVGDHGPRGAARPHPKDMIPLMAQVQRAMALEKEQSLDAMIARLEEILDEHPDLYHARHILGKAYFRAGEYDLAEQEFIECLNMRPDHAKPLMSLARLKSSQHKIDEARALYRQVVEDHPEHIVAVNEFGMWLLEQGEYGEAVKLLKRALRLEPRDPHLPDTLTDALGAIGRQAEARALFEELLDEQPNLPMVRNALARVLAAEGQTGEAIELLKKGIELSPDELTLVNNLAFLLTTSNDEEYRQPIEAVVMLEAACEKTGYADPKYLHTLAMVYASLYRVDEAVAVAERALKLANSSDDPADQELAPAIGQNLEHYRMLKEQGISPRLLGARPDRRAAMQQLFGPAPSGGAPEPADASPDAEPADQEE